MAGGGRGRGRARRLGLGLVALALAGCMAPGARRPALAPAGATAADPGATAPSAATGQASGAGRALSGPLPAPTADALTALLRAPGPQRDLAELAARMGRVSGSPRRTVAGTPAPRALGSQETFWVHDIQHERYFQVVAVLRAMTDSAYFWVQADQTADQAALEAGARAFSDSVLPAVRAVFGREWSPGVDGDPRLHVLHHQPIAGVAGYFSSTDEFTRAVEPYSNEREMFYINLGSYTPGTFDYLSLLSHELQHMVHWRQDRGEAVWVNEGLSELATVVAGYQQQYGDAFLGDPDLPLMEWSATPGANGPHYAAAFLFFAYLYAQHGEAAIRAIVSSPRPGAAGVEEGLAAVGLARHFDEIFLDWVVANLVDDAVRAEGRYSYRELGIQRVDPRELPAGGAEETVGQYATDYYDLSDRLAEGRLRLAFAGDSEVGLLDPVPDRPGQVWWSGRNDNGDSRLTRAFDLRGVREPRLSFRLWQELEENWDYLYVLASTDGGRRWERLSLEGATDANPNGNNYGRGLTGRSRGWREAVLDLSAYAGQEVLLRFEVVTDDAVSETGVALDDLRLPALGFADDAEAEAGWQAEGWVRLDPRLPQRWGLQAIVEHPEGIDVHRIPVAADGRAEADLGPLPEGASVTLAVSGLTPGTRHPAAYRLSPAPNPTASPAAAATASPPPPQALP